MKNKTTTISIIEVDNIEKTIDDYIYREDEKQEIEEIIEELDHVSSLLDKIAKNKLDYIIEILLANNSRLYEYLKKVAEQSKEKIENIILKKLLAKYKQSAVETNLKDYSDNYKIFMLDLREYPVPSRSETKDWFIKYEKAKKDGDKVAENAIKEKIISSSLKLVAHIARYYTKRGLDIMDLIQEGSFGLVRAVEFYDHSLGYAFSTYAFAKIKARILRAIDVQTKNIAIPVWFLDRFNVHNKLINEEERKLGRDLTDEEITELIGIDNETMRIYKTLLKTNTTSLSEPINEDGGELEEMLEDDVSTDNSAIYNVYKEEFLEGLETSNLSLKEKQIILLRYGFADGNCYTLDAIGKMYNVSRERIRQIEAKALPRLKLDPNFLKKIDINILSEETQKKIETRLSNYRHYKLDNIKPEDLASRQEIVGLRKYSTQKHINLIFEMPSLEKEIISLKTGFYNDTFFSNKSVAKFLSIPFDEIDDLVEAAFASLDKLFKEEYFGTARQL